MEKALILIWSYMKKDEISPQMEQYIKRGRENPRSVSNINKIFRIMGNDEINEICNCDTNHHFKLNCLQHLNVSIMSLLDSYQNNNSLLLLN